MDIPRPSATRRKRLRQALYAGTGLTAVVFASVGLSRIKPAAPIVERATVWLEAVKRGPMLREVRGLGSLVPEDIRWIPAATEARVERILVQPGTAVRPDTVVIELSNPELELAAADAVGQLRAAEAQYTELKVRLESQHLDQRAGAARVQSEYNQAKMQADAQQQLAQQGLVADLTVKLSKVAAEELANRYEIEQRRLEIAAEAIKAQLAVQETQVEQRRALARLKKSQVDSLRVRAGLDGVLQFVPVEVGQRVAPGTNLARVAQPSRLKAVIRVAETQARDIQIGQPASVDTRNGTVSGHVARIDPAVQNGTVTVDLAIDGQLPKGARPDLSVEGTVELEKLADVLYMGRPAQSHNEGEAVGLFRLDKDGEHASRTQVTLGRVSASTVEVRQGLQAGDQVILSDTAAWDSFDRIRLK